ncbi:MAG: hypothetical protein IPK16_22880 [Anaerolineales bacterium]|nr:hypothetical protein [Anaerolineales bacterium]
MSDAPPRSEYSWRRIVVALLLLAILIGLLYGGYQTTRTGLAAWEAYRAAERVAGMVRRPAGTYELPALRANLTQLDASLGEVQKGVEPVQGLLPSLADVPQVGKTLVVLPELLDAGRQAAQLGIVTIDKVGPEIIAAAGGGADIATLATALAKAGPALPELAPLVVALDKTLQGLPADALPPHTGRTVTPLARKRLAGRGFRPS